MDSKAKEEKVYKVFQEISEGYDDANTRISLGMEKGWKKNLISLFSQPACTSVLDVCCGTGDISIALKTVNQKCEITGLDFSPAMLEVAKKKSAQNTLLKDITWIEGNAMSLPFPDNSFDGVCISFGLRNTPDYETVLSEMLRVVKPEGIVACLDSFVPDNSFIKFFYNIYFKGIMPRIGGKNEHREEYNWLANSTEAFLRCDELKELFVKIGIRNVKVKKMMCGSCCLHYGTK